MSKLMMFLTGCVFFMSCKRQENPSRINEDLFHPAESAGTLNKEEINEASGLVMSISNPGKFWTHNDSGDKARIFLMDAAANYQATVNLAGITNRDWEDITVGPGPEPGVNYIYVGEIGDNNARYPDKNIYRFKEPLISGDVRDTIVYDVETIQFNFPDGQRDAEALMIDPDTKDLYVFSKREKKINVYQLPFPQNTKKEIKAEKVLSELPYTQIVAADWSADGKEVLIKNYDSIYYWKRSANESITETLKKRAARIPYSPEPQGEAIAFDRDGKGFYTISEESGLIKPVLYFYKRK